MHTSLFRSCHSLHCFASNCRCLITPCRRWLVLRELFQEHRHMSSARVIIWRSIPRFSFSVVLYGAMTWIARRELFVFNHFFKYKTEMKYSLIAILLFSFTALQAQVKGTVRIIWATRLRVPTSSGREPPKVPPLRRTVLSPCPNPMTSICL